VTQSPGRVWLALLLILVLVAAAAPASDAEDGHFFPYPVHKQTLENGLDVLVIPTPEFKDVLSYNTLILAGARNEVEPGKSGLAHLFEHILFRHRLDGVVDGYDEVITELGVFNNAWTWFDVTYYHPVTFTSNFERLSQIEADRFINLDITEKIFQTEAGAVFGEYRLNNTPNLKMSEVTVELLYGDYGYGHTTIGYLEDVEDMPNEYVAAQQFYDDYYRPNNAVVLVTGDVDPNVVFPRVAKLYESWEPKPTLEIPAAGPVDGPKHQATTWATDVPPRVRVAFRMPPHESKSVETAVGQVLVNLLTSETAPLFQKLRYEKGVASNLSSLTSFYEAFGPGPILLTATLYKEKFEQGGTGLLKEVEADMIAATDALKEFSSRPDAVEVLNELKSSYRYDLLAQFDSPGNIAQTFCWYYRFERDPDVFDNMVKAVSALTPQDIDRLAARVFVPENRVTVTLHYTPEESSSDTGSGSDLDSGAQNNHTARAAGH